MRLTARKTVQSTLFTTCAGRLTTAERIEELKRQVEEIKAGGAKAETTAEPQSENVENAEKQSEDHTNIAQTNIGGRR